jgi:hypothetical protein
MKQYVGAERWLMSAVCSAGCAAVTKEGSRATYWAATINVLLSAIVLCDCVALLLAGDFFCRFGSAVVGLGGWGMLSFGSR